MCGITDADIKALYNEGKGKSYPEIAQILYDKIANDSNYRSYLKELFEQTNQSSLEIHKKILSKFDVVFTTNFDNAFECCCDDNNIKYNVHKLPIFNPFILFKNVENTKDIVHLHGYNIDEIYIFKQSDYDAYYPSVSGEVAGSHELEDFLRCVIKYTNLIFIGFSFDDKIINEFIGRVLNEIKIEKDLHKKLFFREHPYEEVEHYAIIPEDFENIEEIEKLGIKPITFSVSSQFHRRMFKEIPNILDEITTKLTSQLTTKEEVGEEAADKK